jgi:glycosyltransferase involved in cell wall biosynthesis
VAAGRLAAEKGFDLLIEAIALLSDPRIHLTILGEGPLRGELEALARERGVSERVRFAGFQANPYVFFAKASALVMSSRFEPFPNVVLEALACGTPVIATPAPGGILEILEGRPGCAVAHEISARSLADAIAQYRFGDRRGPAEPELPEYSATHICAEFAALFSPMQGRV